MSFLFKALLHSLYFKVCLSKPQLTTVCAVVHFEPVFMATKSRRGYNFGIAVPLYWLGCRLHDLGQGNTSLSAHPPSRGVVAGAV